MFRILGFVLLFFITNQASAEFASKFIRHDDYRLYYVEQDNRVYRATCEKGVYVYDRATCKRDILAVAPDIFFPILDSKFGKKLEEYRGKMRDAWINIQRVDTKLMELASADEANEEGAPSFEDIERTNAQLVALETRLSETNDQIVRAEQRLKQQPDLEVVQQLELLRKRAADISEDIGTLAAQLTEMHLEYVKARVEDDDAHYHQLTKMRQSFLTQWLDHKKNVQRQTEDMILGHQLSSYLREVGFTWVSTTNSPIMGSDHFRDAFIEAELAQRTWSYKSNKLEHKVVFDVTESGELESIKCHLSLPITEEYFNHCWVHFTAPERRAVYEFKHQRENIKFDTERSSIGDHLKEHGFYEPIQAGEWKIALSCKESDWQDRQALTDCRLRFKSKFIN